MRRPDLLLPPAWAGDRLGSFLTRVDTDTGVRRLRAAVWAMIGLGVLGFLVEGANRPANPYLSNQLLIQRAHAAPAPPAPASPAPAPHP